MMLGGHIQCISEEISFIELCLTFSAIIYIYWLDYLSTNDYFQDMQLPEGTDHEYPSIPAISDQLPEMLLSNEGKGFRLTNFPDFPLQLFRI